MTGFEPAISALTGPHVSRYTTSPFRFAFQNLFLLRSTFSILAYHLFRVKGFAKFVTFNFFHTCWEQNTLQESFSR